jgi:glycosyltransferase involved in cell wall biosynthesis
MDITNLIFLDCTCDKNHKVIKNKAVGASEYQFYNLIYNFSCIKKNSIYCYNYTNNKNLEIDNIFYSDFKYLVDHPIDKSSRIIIQRFFPWEENLKYKVYNHNVYIWIHDIPDILIFVGNNEHVIKYYEIHQDSFKSYLKEFFIDKPNIRFIFNSYHCKNMFVQFLNKYDFIMEENRLIVIYNILYEDELILVKKKIVPINNKQLVYASTWQKGIQDVINLFENILKRDNTFTLVLMNPGYGMESYIEYKNNLIRKFKNNIIIYDALSKDKYSEVIKSSLCVLSSKFNETFGCVFAESYYLGTPVIADVNSGAVKEIIDNKFIIDYNNPDLVFTRLNEIYRDRQRCKIELSDNFLFQKNFMKWKHFIQ